MPHTLAEALDARASRPDAVPVAGGTDLMVEVNARRRRPPALLDLSRVPELREWRRDGDVVRVGAGVTFARLADELSAFVPLTQAARVLGSPQIRSRATIGGNVATASPAGDGLAVLAAYDAGVVCASAARGERTVSWREFLLGPKRTALAADEIVVGVEWTAVRGPGVFAKVGPRNAMVISVAGVCVQLDEEARRVRIALGSVGPTVLRADRAEAFAAGALEELGAWDGRRAVLARVALAEVARLAAAGASPIDDIRGSAAYRRHAVGVMCARALSRTLEPGRAAC